MMYRIDLEAVIGKGEDDFQAACDMEDWLSERGVLVPVEPDYEAMWCFTHGKTSERCDRDDPLGDGTHDIAKAYVTRVDAALKGDT